MKSLVFIPSYNDKKHLETISREILSLDGDFNILIVDDGSTPPLQLDFQHPRISLFRIPFNAGLGVATNIAIDFSLSHEFNFMVRIDADGQHSTRYLNMMKKILVSRDMDVCIGVRTNHESFITFHGYLATITKRHINFLLNSLSNFTINDWNSGCYTLNQSALKKLSMYRYARYPESELYLRAQQSGLSIATLEIEQIKRTDGKSTLTFWPSVRLLIRLYAIAFRHLIESIFK